MDLTIQVKNVYGNELVYPICEKAIMLCQLTGQKTFNKEAIQLIKKLGYSFSHKEIKV